MSAIGSIGGLAVPPQIAPIEGAPKPPPDSGTAPPPPGDTDTGSQTDTGPGSGTERTPWPQGASSPGDGPALPERSFVATTAPVTGHSFDAKRLRDASPTGGFAVAFSPVDATVAIAPDTDVTVLFQMPDPPPTDADRAMSFLDTLGEIRSMEPPSPPLPEMPAMSVADAGPTDPTIPPNMGL